MTAHEIPTVTVSAGLVFVCPCCGAPGHRAAEGTDLFAVPLGHSAATGDHRFLITCGDRDWWLVFADARDDPPFDVEAELAQFQAWLREQGYTDD